MKENQTCLNFQLNLLWTNYFVYPSSQFSLNQICTDPHLPFIEEQKFLFFECYHEKKTTQIFPMTDKLKKKKISSLLNKAQKYKKKNGFDFNNYKSNTKKVRTKISTNKKTKSNVNPFQSKKTQSPPNQTPLLSNEPIVDIIQKNEKEIKTETCLMTPQNGNNNNNVFNKHSVFMGNRSCVTRVISFIERRLNLPFSKPVALLIKGSSGCGKTTLLNECQSVIGLSADVFDVDDFFSRTNLQNNLRTSVETTFFSKKKIVIVDNIDKVSNIDVVTKLLERLHGIDTKKQKKFPIAGNPIVFTCVDLHSQNIQSIDKFCMTVKIPRPSYLTLDRLITEFAKNKGRLLKNKNMIIDSCAGDGSFLLSQAQFLINSSNTEISKKNISSKDTTKKSSHIYETVSNIIWKEEKFDSNLHGNFVKDLIIANIHDNRTNIHDISEFYDNIYIDTKNSEIETELTNMSVNLLPRGKPHKIIYFKNKKSNKYTCNLKEAAEVHRLTIRDLLFTMIYTDEVTFTVFDKKYGVENDISITKLQAKNKLVRSCASYIQNSIKH